MRLLPVGSTFTRVCSGISCFIVPGDYLYVTRDISLHGGRGGEMISRHIVGIILVVIGGVLGVIAFAMWRYPGPEPGVAAFLASYLVIGGAVFLILGREAGPLSPVGPPSSSLELKGKVSSGRLLLLLGSALLLASLSLPWVTLSAPCPEGCDRASSGLDPVRVLPVSALGRYGALAIFGWLILVAAIGVTSAFVGRTFSWTGISGIIVLALDAILIYVVATLSYAQPSVAFEYGFLVAALGSALIETGARLKKPAATIAPMRNPLSPGLLFIVIGIVSSVGGILTTFAGISRDAYVWAIAFGWVMVVLGMAFIARPSLASPARARPSEVR